MHSDFMIDALRLAAEEYLLDQASMRVDLSNLLKYKNKQSNRQVGIITMDAISYSNFRINLASTLDKVNDDHTLILITRQNGKPAIVSRYKQ